MPKHARGRARRKRTWLKNVGDPNKPGFTNPNDGKTYR